MGEGILAGWGSRSWQNIGNYVTYYSVLDYTEISLSLFDCPGFSVTTLTIYSPANISNMYKDIHTPNQYE